MMPASPRPPCQCPISDTAKSIMRRATPPCDRKLPARMKNGIAMISKLSRPVNSFIDTASIGTVVRMNMNVSTVRPSAIDTGMPVTMKEISKMKMISARTDCGNTMIPALCAKQIAKIRIGAMIRVSASGLDQRLETVPCVSVDGCSPSAASMPSTCASL